MCFSECLGHRKRRLLAVANRAFLFPLSFLNTFLSFFSSFFFSFFAAFDCVVFSVGLR